MAIVEKRTGPLAPGIAFITGGARGLGNAVAVSFAKEGARGIALIDIQDESTFNAGKAEVEAYGTKVLVIRADVTIEEEVERAVEQTVQEFGRIDYAANFAGVIGPPERIADLDIKDWQKVLAVNTTGVLICVKHEMRQMMKQSSIAVESGRISQQGSIVNCASVNSLMAIAGSAGYTGSKHAVHGITKTAALEGREHHIRVNAVSPGFLLTEIGKAVEQFGGNLWAGFENRQGRTARFEEVGDVVVLMSLPRMSLVNAQNLFIDGGFTINEGNS